jgi:hypothetical protein
MNIWLIQEKSIQPSDLLELCEKYGHHLHYHLDPAPESYNVACFFANAQDIGYMAHGIPASMVSRFFLCMPSNKKSVIVPTTAHDLWMNQAIINNVSMLKSNGCAIVDPFHDEQLKYNRRAPAFEIIAACDTSKFMFDYIPLPPHPGSFGVKRRHHYHTGVDLYVHRSNAAVYPFEDGEIVAHGFFTGIECGSPWWNTTEYIAIKSGEYVTVYGEIETDEFVPEIGKKVTTKDRIGKVIPVTKNRHPEFHYHNNKMLHVERHLAHKFHDTSVSEWEIDKKQPDILLDPTEFLQSIKGE